MKSLEMMGNALLAAQKGRQVLARTLGKSLVNGAKRLRRMGRTYLELSERAAIVKLRTWC